MKNFVHAAKLAIVKQQKPDEWADVVFALQQVCFYSPECLEVQWFNTGDRSLAAIAGTKLGSMLNLSEFAGTTIDDIIEYIMADDYHEKSN